MSVIEESTTGDSGYVDEALKCIGALRRLMRISKMENVDASKRNMELCKELALSKQRTDNLMKEMGLLIKNSEENQAKDRRILELEERNKELETTVTELRERLKVVEELNEQREAEVAILHSELRKVRSSIIQMQPSARQNGSSAPGLLVYTQRSSATLQSSSDFVPARLVINGTAQCQNPSGCGRAMLRAAPQTKSNSH